MKWATPKHVASCSRLNILYTFFSLPSRLMCNRTTTKKTRWHLYCILSAAYCDDWEKWGSLCNVCFCDTWWMAYTNINLFQTLQVSDVGINKYFSSQISYLRCVWIILPTYIWNRWYTWTSKPFLRLHSGALYTSYSATYYYYLIAAERVLHQYQRHEKGWCLTWWSWIRYQKVLKMRNHIMSDSHPTNDSFRVCVCTVGTESTIIESH